MLLDTARRSFRPGLIAGFVFGVWDLLWTWLQPLADDTVAALLQFYGPMFAFWAFIAFTETKRTGSVVRGVVAGAAVALGTFSIFTLLNFVRVNVFLEQLTGRADWQSLVARFQVSGADSLRVFVNLDYLKGTPTKLGAATAIGAACGLCAAAAASLQRRIARRAT